MSDELNKIFGVKPVEVIDTNGESIVVVPDGDEDVDHTYARAQTYNLIEKGTEALNIAMKVLRESENPAAIKELSGLLKNLAEINKTLVVLNKDKAEVKTAKGAKQTPSIGTAVQTQNNIVFTGSSKELNKMLAEQSKDGK